MSHRRVAGRPDRRGRAERTVVSSRHRSVSTKRRQLNDGTAGDVGQVPDEHVHGNEHDDEPVHKDKGKGRARTLPALPSDVWKRIFDIYYDQEGREWDRTGRKVDLMAPLLVSSDMAAMALASLYEHPHLNHDTLASFAKCVTLPTRVLSGNSKVPLVRHLTICPCPLAPLGQTDQNASVRLALSKSLLATCRLFGPLRSLTIKNIWIRGWKEADMLFESLRHVQPRKARLEIQSWHPSWVPLYNPRVASAIEQAIEGERHRALHMGPPGMPTSTNTHPMAPTRPPPRPRLSTRIETMFSSPAFRSTLLLFFLHNVPFGTAAYWHALEQRVELLGTEKGSVPPELEGILETRTRFQKWAGRSRPQEGLEARRVESFQQTSSDGDDSVSVASRVVTHGDGQEQGQTRQRRPGFIARSRIDTSSPTLGEASASSSSTAFDLPYASSGPGHHAVIPTLRWRLHAILTRYWSQSLEAFSLVIADKLGTSLVQTDDLDFWPTVAIPHIRLNLPERPLVIFQDRRPSLRAQQGPPRRLIGGDGYGGGLVHNEVRIFEFELNTPQDFEDDMWATCSGQLPPQVCRILKGEQDWRDVVPGQVHEHEGYTEVEVGSPPSPSESEFDSPTFSFASLDEDEDGGEDEDMEQDEGQWYDAEAARAQREKLAARGNE